MTQNQYDYIIIGAGQKDLTPSPSPLGEGNKKPPFYTGACGVKFICYALVRKYVTPQPEPFGISHPAL